MATNGEETFCFLKQIDPKEFVTHFDLPEYKMRNNSDHSQPSKLIKPLKYNIDQRKTGLIEMDYRTYSHLLFNCHSIMRDHQGLHADQALDEMCKIIYTKIYDEISTANNSNFRFQSWIYSSAEELASSIRTIYIETRERELTELDHQIKGYSSSRGVFREEIKLNDSVIETIVVKIQGYSIIDTKMDVKRRAFEQFLQGKIRQSMS